MKKLIYIVAFIIFFIFVLGIGKKAEVLREASFYTQLKNSFVRCDLCPNNCVIKENAFGDCGVRQNIDGKLYSVVYGYPVSIHVDPIEKKPLYHFFPGTKILSIATVGCNLRCNFCQNWTISQSSPAEVKTNYTTPEEIIAICKKYNCKSIAFTYTEPTVFYEYMFDIAKLAKEEGIYTVWVTCGYINEKPLRELTKYIDAANIDLKGFSEEFYHTYTTGELQPVLNTIKIAQDNMIFEITNLIIPNANDSPQLIHSMCSWIRENTSKDIPLHFSRFFPNYKLKNKSPTPLKTLHKAYEIAKRESLHYVYIGNVGEIAEDTFCPYCGKKLIDRQGYYIKKIRIKDGRCSFCNHEIYGKYND